MTAKSVSAWLMGLSVVLPIVVVLVSTIFIESVSKQLASVPTLRAVLVASTGVAFTVGFLSLNGTMSKLCLIPGPLIGGIRGIVAGLSIGLAASILSGFLFVTFSGTGNWASFGTGLPLRLLGNVYPAGIEEAGFRAGIVHFLNHFFGQGTALAGGSLPFGIIHLFGRVFGNPVDFQHVVGASAAGLLLSALYLRFGFIAAFFCHWIWNSMARSWVNAAGGATPNGLQRFEGAWSTTLVLLLLAVPLLVLWRAEQSR